MSDTPRAIRVLLVANDGMSAGHVVRTVAIARALARRAASRGFDARIVLATTSEAHSLLDDASFAVIRLPPPLTARRAGFGDLERRRLVRGAFQGIAGSFGPDVVVCDTFPLGPHGELEGVDLGSAKRVLVRRATKGEDSVVSGGLEGYDLAIVADDPVALEVTLSVRVVRVPPITLGEATDTMDRASARRELGLPVDGRAILIAAGGGGDAEAVHQAREVAALVERCAPGVLVVRAVGPLERGESHGGCEVRVAPLLPVLSAFDGAVVPAGYNTAHELAKAGVPSALFARPRLYDDQSARARRFAHAGLATVLETLDEAAIVSALEWMQSARKRAIPAGGADRAADAVLDLFGEAP